MTTAQYHYESGESCEPGHTSQGMTWIAENPTPQNTIKF